MTRWMIRVWAVGFGLGLFFSGAAHCEDHKPKVDWITPTLFYGAGQGADLYTTLHQESLGAREANPLIGQGSGAVYGAKGAAFAILETTDIVLQKHGHKGWAWAERIAATVVSGVVVAHNLRAHR